MRRGTLRAEDDIAEDVAEAEAVRGYTEVT